MHDMPRLGSGIPLLARDNELARLRDAFHRAEIGAANAVLVSGEAGVGKTRLIEELIASVRDTDTVVLTGRCVGAAIGLPYLPFADVLGQLRVDYGDFLRRHPALARLFPEFVGHVDELSQYSSVKEEADLSRLRLFDAIDSLFTELSEEHCLLIILEDMHWADSSSRNLLSFVVSRLRTQRLLIVATYRGEELHRQHPLRSMLTELTRLSTVERIDLEPFTPEDTVAFVRELADATLPEETVQGIALRSEGIPFFIEELLANCTDSGSLSVPQGLADTLLARIERLTPNAQRILRVASAGGRDIHYAALQSIVDLPFTELEEAIRELVQHNIVLPRMNEESYSFRHALLREAIYNDLLPIERVRLHAAYARHIASSREIRGNAARLAYHSMESHDLPTALSASVQAAIEAEEVGAPTEALHFVKQALKLWDKVTHPEEHSELSQLELCGRAGYLAMTLGELELARSYAYSAVRLADQQGKLELSVRYRHRLAARLLNMDGKASEALQVIDEAWNMVTAEPPSAERAAVLSVRARVLRILGRQGEARQMAEEALSDAIAAKAKSQEADALNTLAVLDYRDGLVDAASKRLTIARDRAAEIGAISVELRAQYWLGVVRYEQGLLGEAIRIFEAGLAKAQHNGLIMGPSGTLMRILLAYSQYLSGDWDASLSTANWTGDPAASIATASVAATGLFVLVGRGRFDEALVVLDKLRPSWNRDFQIPLCCASAEAELSCWQGNPRHAIDILRDGLAVLKTFEQGVPVGIRLAVLGVAAAADLAEQSRGRRDIDAERAAIAAAEEFTTAARLAEKVRLERDKVIGPESRAWMARLEAEIARLHGANEIGAWQAVVDGFADGFGYDQAQARWRLGAAMLRQDETKEAAQQLRLSYEVAERLGAQPLQGSLLQLAQRARITLGNQEESVPRDRLDLLTEREQAVLALVASGLTNREVGAKLYISEKTVSVHWSRIMAKLGATRRPEAIALAYDRGLLNRA